AASCASRSMVVGALTRPSRRATATLPAVACSVVSRACSSGSGVRGARAVLAASVTGFSLAPLPPAPYGNPASPPPGCAIGQADGQLALPVQLCAAASALACAHGAGAFVARPPR